ncbi:hypothetical protein QYM36_019740 [Artemia franciscana]|uniref:Uncharacterized protein n=1 Tax=Artemia franciscana TaxID=6661 RepID=A0AA88KQT3_ARTSF|nr:hypothetical protein QYM36_019740 [Artemia franciscana]
MGNTAYPLFLDMGHDLASKLEPKDKTDLEESMQEQVARFDDLSHMADERMQALNTAMSVAKLHPDWKEFMAALRPDWEEKPAPDAEKIHDEVSDKYKNTHVEQNSEFIKVIWALHMHDNMVESYHVPVIGSIVVGVKNFWSIGSMTTHRPNIHYPATVGDVVAASFKFQ